MGDGRAEPEPTLGDIWCNELVGIVALGLSILLNVVQFYAYLCHHQLPEC